MKRYETIFILDPDLEEEPLQTALDRIKGIITQYKGEIFKDEDWGKRKLAYDIKKKPRGHYRLMEFSGSPALLSELERNFRVMDAVMKFQTILLDERKASTSKTVPPEEPPEEETEPEETPT
jgi:small subunit ribosomal protein S6